MNSDDKRRSYGGLDVLSGESIALIVSLASAAAGLTHASIKAISLWVEDRKGRSIRISDKNKGVEMTITGAMSQKDIEDKIALFVRGASAISADTVVVQADDSDASVIEVRHPEES